MHKMSSDLPSTPDAILEAFATAGPVLPRQAMRDAVARWDDVGPILLDLLREAADSPVLTRRMTEMLFFGIFLMAQFRDTRAFAPLCRFSANGDHGEEVLGDGVMENLSCILARTYDGDLAALQALIEAPEADEFARDAAFEALAWLTATGRVDREVTEQYLGGLFTTMQPQHESQVWTGWQGAIALLGFETLAPLVERAFQQGWVDAQLMGLEDFHADLREAREVAWPNQAVGGRMLRIDDHDDAEALLSTWWGFKSDEERRRERATYRPGSREAPLPILPKGLVFTETGARNPLRDVGRNDPCPCGSGKKFKKCCVEHPEAALRARAA
jgi:hypothetical protein